MTVQPTVAVVTGANRGIGLAICQRLVATATTPLVLYALSRKGSDLGLKPHNSAIQVQYAQLHLTKQDSVDAVAASIRQQYQGCDVLINNAGVFPYSQGETPEERQEALDVNYRGTLRVCRAFMPIMRDGGRIVNVSSTYGLLRFFGPRIQARFRESLGSYEAIDDVVAEYERDAAAGQALSRGWAPMTYYTTKAALNAATMVMARDNPQLLINTCCPGWADTGLGQQAGPPPKTTYDGAAIPLRLGFGDIGSSTGKYWSNDSVKDKGDGQIRDWTTWGT